MILASVNQKNRNDLMHFILLDCRLLMQGFQVPMWYDTNPIPDLSAKMGQVFYSNEVIQHG